MENHFKPSKIQLKRKVKTELQERAYKLAESLPKYNGMAYLKVKTEEFATHWMPLEDDDKHENITLGKLYRLYWDEFDSEHMINDDNNQLGTLFMVHNGVFVILESSNQWHDYVEQLQRKEWMQTDEYKNMMRESMEFMRRSERED
jgi:hypothetical protein